MYNDGAYDEKTNTQKSIIAKISECIMATKFPTHPKNLLEKIICDADVYHFGPNAFETMNKRMFKEVKLRNSNNNFSCFNDQAISMLESHRFFTGYCKYFL